jgi:hypothetical protein
VKCLHSDRGPIKLHNCKIDTQIIVSALIGNSRVTKLKLYYARSTNEADMAVLVAAIANNRGLEELDFEDGSISDDNWSILCESLKAHPTLTILNLFDNRPIIFDDIDDDDGLLSDEAQKAHRTRLLADMVQANTIMLTIELARYERDDHIYTDEILPYLETNRYRPRVLAIKKTIERPFREKKVLGRALFCAKSNPNLVWMFLSQNVDAFVRSGAEEVVEEEDNSEVAVSVSAAAAVVAVVAVAGSKRKC